MTPFEQHPYFYPSADLALQHTGGIAAAEYGRYPCGHPPFFSELGATSTTATWGISTGAPPRPPSRFRFRFNEAFNEAVFHAYPALVLHPRFPRNCFSF